MNNNDNVMNYDDSTIFDVVNNENFPLYVDYTYHTCQHSAGNCPTNRVYNVINDSINDENNYRITISKYWNKSAFKTKEDNYAAANGIVSKRIISGFSDGHHGAAYEMVDYIKEFTDESTGVFSPDVPMIYLNFDGSQDDNMPMTIEAYEQIGKANVPSIYLRNPRKGIYANEMVDTIIENGGTVFEIDTIHNGHSESYNTDNEINGGFLSLLTGWGEINDESRYIAFKKIYIDENGNKIEEKLNSIDDFILNVNLNASKLVDYKPVKYELNSGSYIIYSDYNKVLDSYTSLRSDLSKLKNSGESNFVFENDSSMLSTSLNLSSKVFSSINNDLYSRLLEECDFLLKYADNIQNMDLYLSSNLDIDSSSILSAFENSFRNNSLTSSKISDIYNYNLDYSINSENFNINSSDIFLAKNSFCDYLEEQLSYFDIIKSSFSDKLNDFTNLSGKGYDIFRKNANYYMDRLSHYETTLSNFSNNVSVLFESLLSFMGENPVVDSINAQMLNELEEEKKNNLGKIEELNSYIKEMTVLKRSSIDKNGETITSSVLVHVHSDWKEKANYIEELTLRNKEIDKLIDKIYFVLDQYKKIYEAYENQVNSLIKSYSTLFNN